MSILVWATLSTSGPPAIAGGSQATTKGERREATRPATPRADRVPYAVTSAGSFLPFWPRDGSLALITSAACGACSRSVLNVSIALGATT